VCSQDAIAVAPPDVDLAAQPEIGIKNFEDLNASMAAVTGISPTTASVKTTYDTVKQALPTAEAIEGFSSSQQSAITQLAVAYCNALATDSGRRAAYFPGFNFGEASGTAFNSAAKRDQIIVPLYTRAVGQNLGSQPPLTDSDPNAVSVSEELNNLIDTLTTCSGAGCANTQTVVTAVCAATLGSAVTTVQ
jgi:hypothetical protein